MKAKKARSISTHSKVNETIDCSKQSNTRNDENYNYYYYNNNSNNQN